MKPDIQPPQGSKTVLVDRYGRAPQQVALTDAEHAPRIENIDALMVFNARLAPDETIRISLNPLVAAASDVLSFVVGIERNVQQHTRDTLSAYLTKAIKAFEATALRNGIESTQVMSARYVLCTVVDEAIATTAWGNESDWPQRVCWAVFTTKRLVAPKSFNSLSRSPGTLCATCICWSCCTCVCRWALRANSASKPVARWSWTPFATACIGKSATCAVMPFAKCLPIGRAWACGVTAWYASWRVGSSWL